LQITLSTAISIVGQPFSGLPAHSMNAQSLSEHFAAGLLPDILAGVMGMRFCAESHLICGSGITGADLRDRIVRIMAGHLVQKMVLSKKLLLGGVALASLAIPVAFGLSAKLDTATTMHANSPGQLGKPATTTENAAVDLAPLSLASIRLVAPAANDAMLTQFSDVGVTFRSIAIASIVHHSICSSITRPASARPILWWLPRMVRNSTRQKTSRPNQVVLAAPTERLTGTNRQ
jgi:hypothetical protein